MGQQDTKSILDNATRSEFIHHLLNDIKALEIMLDKGLFEDDVTRIGAEQEFCLVNENWRPANNAQQILQEVNDDHFTTEIARFNLEINLDPIELKEDCFSKVKSQLDGLLKKAAVAADSHGSKIVLTGILPSIGKREIDVDYMTPNQRYWDINQITKELRGSDFELNLSGVDELSLTHDSVLLEACNTSFQTHLQVPSHDFVSSYNWSQVIAGPILSMCTNSPLLLGRELWSETRIALFQQSIDTRRSSHVIKEQRSRVTLGNQWAKGSAVDIFKNDVALYKVLLATEIEKDSLEELSKGNIPSLRALGMHNSTIYRWNRACYGVSSGKPHLRIENRYIPAGPTVIDEIANFAFWVGLMKGRPAKYDDMSSQLDFRDAKANFVNAARTGRDSSLHWMGRRYPVPELITNELLPIAYSGLEKMKIDKNDIEKLLGIIEQRTRKVTGSKWIIRNYRKLRTSAKQDSALRALTRGIHENQKIDKPIHEWDMLDDSQSIKDIPHQVGHIMSTKLFVANENDLAKLATNVMEWKDIHHLPVEDSKGNLCGLLTWTHLSKYKEQEELDQKLIVSDIMTREVVTVQPETEIRKAIHLMKKLEYGCMPVVKGTHLVGIITIKDVIPFDNE